MQTFLLYFAIMLAIVVPLMFLFRRRSVAKQEADMRAQRLLQDTVLTGVKTMRGAEHNSKRQPMSDRANAARDKKPALKKVETSTDNTPDDLMLLSAVHLNSTPTPISNYDDDTRKIAGGGGTFDGGGSSGDWGRPDPAPSAPSCDSDRYSSSSGSSSYDGGSSYSSSSSDSSSSSSSSDSGSSSCSSD